MTRVSRTLGTALALSLLLPLLTVSSAHAALAQRGDPIVISFEPSSVTAEYGNIWEFSLVTENTACADADCTNSLDVFLNGDNGEGTTITTTIYDNQKAFIGNFDLAETLKVGTYELTGDTDGKVEGTPVASTNKPGRLTITPAALSVSLLVESDPNQPSAAVVSAQLLGTFVDGVMGCYGSSNCHDDLPDGTWTFTVTDDSGAVVHEESLATKDVASQYASFYWHGVAASSTYRASATFAPDADLAKNFTIEPATDVSFTSPDPVEAGDPGAPVVPAVEPEPESGPSLPLWLVILGGVVLLVLAVGAGVFARLIYRRRNPVALDDGGDEEVAETLADGNNA